MSCNTYVFIRQINALKLVCTNVSIKFTETFFNYILVLDSDIENYFLIPKFCRTNRDLNLKWYQKVCPGLTGHLKNDTKFQN